MYARTARLIVLVGLVVLVLAAATVAPGAVSVGGSVKIASPLGSTCGASATCNAAVFVCEPETMMKDGVDVSIVNVGAFANRTGALTFSQIAINPIIAHVRLEFFNFSCFLLESATVTATAARDVAVPYDAKWMMVTTSWSRDLNWTMTLKP